jgi:membrane peptidoglycan carboxypeptidase
VPARGFLRRHATAVGLLAVLLAAGGYWVAEEIETSRFQATQLAAYARSLSFQVLKGPSEAIRFPLHGPFDQRMGYTELPRFAQRLTDRGYALTEQARFSKDLLDYTGHGLFAPYREKTRAGLDMADCRGKPLHGFRYPYRGYADFAAVPPRVAQALMFIENRDLLDESRPQMNPVDWVRFARAVLGRVGHLVSSDFDAPGGSTLATQIEFRHSRDGVTYSGSEKLRQMASASVRAYQDGEETLPARRRLLLDYLNTVPLSARRAWRGQWPRRRPVGVVRGRFRRRQQAARRARSQRPGLAAQGRALHQVVALMIAHRRPSFYLAGGGRERLGQLSASYLRLFAENGVISPPCATRPSPSRSSFATCRPTRPCCPPTWARAR